jgi:cytidylate kinase
VLAKPRRPAAQLRARGEIVDINEILGQIVARDTRDATRSVGPLAIAVDAEVIDTTGLSQQQVVDHMVSRIQSAPAGQQVK